MTVTKWYILAVSVQVQKRKLLDIYRQTHDQVKVHHVENSKPHMLPAEEQLVPSSFVSLRTQN